jgi:hypothetical protein
VWLDKPHLHFWMRGIKPLSVMLWQKDTSSTCGERERERKTERQRERERERERERGQVSAGRRDRIIASIPPTALGPSPSLGVRGWGLGVGGDDDEVWERSSRMRYGMMRYGRGVIGRGEVSQGLLLCHFRPLDLSSWGASLHVSETSRSDQLGYGRGLIGRGEVSMRPLDLGSCWRLQ